MINRIGFVLVKPQLSENIGFSARGLKNFGFNKLDLVSPEEIWPNKKAIATSVGAKDILNKTRKAQEIIMPVMKSGRGYKYGTSGKTYKGKGAKKKATNRDQRFKQVNGENV